jgi:trehalose 6-phosphate synthase
MPSALSSVEPLPRPGPAGPGSEPLVIASNRLPIRWDAVAEQWVRSSGGLVAALEPVIAARGGSWVGWADGPRPPDRAGFSLEPVTLSADEVSAYYEGYANATLWPALHDAIEPVEHRPEWWEVYQRVNARFADVLARSAPAASMVWVHDYHLLLVPRLLRAVRPDVRIGFFLHTPWPALSVSLGELPEIAELVAGLEGADLIGFQRERDEARFRALRSSLRRDRTPALATGVFPISIDWSQWAELAEDPVVLARARRIRDALGLGRRLLVGVDRMDYSKGIIQRLDAIELLLRRGRLQPHGFRLVQIAVASRQGVPAYRRLRDEVVARVRSLNHRYGRPGDPVVELQEEAAPPRELAALYVAADVALVTPRRDGMNLVAKEFCATQRPDHPGVLVLGRGAGAADELTDAVQVDGGDPLSVAEGIERALALGPLARRRLAAELRDVVRRNDLERWTGAFLDDLALHGPEPGSRTRFRAG